MKTILTLIVTVIIIVLIGYFSKGFSSRKQQPVIVSELNEVFTLYKKSENKIEVVRVVTLDNIKFDLYFYNINVTVSEDAKQQFVSVEHLTKQQLDSKKSELQRTYNWVPFRGKNVLFVQMQPAGFKNETQLLNKRQEIEDKISRVLEEEKLGEWFAGDLGPGGGNMLYFISNINTSLSTILGVLKQNQLENNTIIGRRIRTDKDNWFYEVIYPVDYSGDFNTM